MKISINNRKPLNMPRMLAGINNIVFLIVILIMLAMVCTFIEPKFLTIRNLVNILQQSVTIGLIAIGITFVLITGNIDLSGGAVAALIGVIVGKLLLNGMGVFWAVLLSLLMGALIGTFNGFFIAYLGIPSFIVTLSTMYIARGIGMVITKASIIYGLPKNYMDIGTGTFYKVPISIIILFFMYIINAFLLNKTVFGHKVIAVGSNRTAARLAGIKIPNVIMSVYILMGILAGLCSIILTGRVGGAMYNSADGIEMQAIAGIVIGGTSMSGGKGSMWGTFFGVLLIATLSNGLNMMNVSPYWTKFVQGAAILVAVIIDSINKYHKEQ